VSEGIPDRERWSKDPAVPTIDAPSAPAPESAPSVAPDPDVTVVRRPRSTKTRTGGPRPPRPAGSAPRKPTQVPPATSDAPGAGPTSNLVGENTRVTGGSSFSAGLDHLPKAGPADAPAAQFAPSPTDRVQPSSAPPWNPPEPAQAPVTPPSVLERARAGVVAAATVAKEKVAQVSAPAFAPAPTVPVAPVAYLAPAAADELAPRAVKRSRRTRRARLRISRIDPWSVMKTSLLFGIAGGIIFVVATYVLMSVIEATGLFDAINQMVKDILASPSDTTTFDITTYINTKRATGLAALIGAIDVVIFTALATVFSFLYNLSATMLGGLEITLAED